MHKSALCTSHNNHVQCLTRQLRKLVMDQLVMTTWEYLVVSQFALTPLINELGDGPCLHRSGEAFDRCPVNNFILLTYLFCRSHYLDIHQGLPAAQHVNCLVVLVHSLKEAVKYLTANNILSNLYHPDPHLNTKIVMNYVMLFI